MKYLFIDTEFSHPDCLLTGSLAVTNDNLDLIDHFDFSLSHDIYLVDPEALKVNGIDILKHRGFL